MLLVGTTDGLYEVGGESPSQVAGGEVTCLARGGGRWWALADDRRVLVSDDGTSWRDAAAVPDGLVAHCLAPVADGDAVLVGTSEAHLLRVAADDGDGRAAAAVAPVESFDAIPTRDEWYTPWGAPPDTRSLAVADDGTMFVNVHVGGVWRGEAKGDTWDERVEVDADTHQVVCDGGLVLVAAAVGFAVSTDGGETFRWSTDGLHATYARAVALAGDQVLLTASTGPRTSRAAVYRGDVDGGMFTKVHTGLPEWFGANVDTHCLAASGDTAAFGTGTGDVYASTDAGRSWARVATGLPPVRSVGLG